MKDRSRCQRKPLEKISFEEVMGAAGMSGFGALFEQRPGIEERGWQRAAQTRLKFLMQGAVLAEKLGRQNDALRSLNDPLTHRLTSLREALRILSRIGCAVPAHRTSYLLRPGVSMAPIQSAPSSASYLGA